MNVSAKGVLAHEYGHHIAASRLNPPFASVDYGTKRWATYEDVCAKAERAPSIRAPKIRGTTCSIPGEAFAESYRLLNEQRLALPQDPSGHRHEVAFPDTMAMSLLEQDIVTPWTANATRRLTLKLTAKIRTRNFTLSTPYDGKLSVATRQSGRVKVRASLLSGGSTVGSSTYTRASGGSLSTTVCGKRSYRLRATLPGPVTKTTKTTVTLTVSAP